MSHCLDARNRSAIGILAHRALLARSLAVAAALVVGVTGYWLRPRDRGDREPRATSTTESTAAVAQQARLDLRPFAVTRGDPSRTEPGPLVLPCARVDATLLLPVGADEGAYELRLLDGDLSVQTTASGTAAVVDFVTTLRATLDLQSLSPGVYQLGIRRAGGEWQMFPAQVE